MSQVHKQATNFKAFCETKTTQKIPIKIVELFYSREINIIKLIIDS